MSQSVYVGNLPYSATGDELKEFFSQAGEVASATVITDKFSGRSKGFGFVEMTDAAGAGKAIAELNGQEMDGRAIKVSEARPKEERKPGGFDRR
jgi:RNA recognition motif-containing protein